MKRFSVVALASALALVVVSPALSQAAGQSGRSMTPTAGTSKGHSTHKAKSAMHQRKVDINSATKEQLQALPGIDDAAADKIIAARPFNAKYDLVHKSILTKAQYSKLSSRIVVEQAMKTAPGGKAPQSQSGSGGSSSRQDTPGSK
ncbi:MAG TPA: helix-hairpin-helix domain-containing protein [Candidatus Eisenbacteria bacterium]|jgi:DNA uptake protein ComE-like DNA-binding protein